MGNTGIRVSRLCFGALTIGPLQANLSFVEGARVIRAALEAGVNFIDTAEIYNNYEYIRQALKGFDKDVVVTSKCYAYTREGMAESLEKARRELDRDVIDIFMLHEQESHLTLKGHWEAVEYLLEARAKGIVRAVGLSTHRVAGVKAAVNCGELQVVHPLFNIAGLGIGDGTREDMLEAIREAKEVGHGVYSMKPLGGGNLGRDMEKALNYCLNEPACDAIALGMRSTAEVEMNIALFERRQVPKEVRERVGTMERKLHIDEWCTGCGKCVERCSSSALMLVEGKASVNTDKCLLCGYCAGVCPDFYIKVV